ncbi:2',3'-cyclic-nucleotide 3'-phosphodiesteras-like protein [Glonium stellatum]|uniref:2',3'-cyclic-nucleotide 3'-phosphodiesteras-like protein n=1 Tax=Glonium stellatum TaxID=574774 RepID=A0A8E2EQR9_9PEZI|nr:2',3'-cyclic-nucleotide 3'-phosphodiesteras-like protein [Glonium stellatum]
MPGSSLWLLPPQSHPLAPLLTTLIKTVSAHFNSPHTFVPHVTLTSEISPSIYEKDPQAWLNSLDFPKADDVTVKFERLETSGVFFRKMTIRVAKQGVRPLATVARSVVEGYAAEEQSKKWVEEIFGPHLSLLYADVEVSEESGKEMETVVRETGVSPEGVGELGSWVGGSVVLVPTDMKIEDWNPIAARNL